MAPRKSLWACALSASQGVCATQKSRLKTPQYSPSHVSCPQQPITRSAEGITPSEALWAEERKVVADAALREWLSRVDPSFDSAEHLPTIAISYSGGGYRSMLTSAGVRQAFDIREGISSMSGLLQCFSWESAISGGGWMLGSISNSGWPTVSSMLADPWTRQLGYGLLYPQGDEDSSLPFYALIELEMLAKSDAGFNATAVDIYGLLLERMLFKNPPQGKLSDIRSDENFLARQVPLPVLAATGVQQYGSKCPQRTTANSQFEFTPFEWGAWDRGIAAFADTEYMGSTPGMCVTGFDSVSMIVGTISDAPGTECGPGDPAWNAEATYGRAGNSDNLSFETLMPNPFYGNNKSYSVANVTTLQLVDGGEADMGQAVWPILWRPVDVLFVSDNTAAGPENMPNFQDLYNTYLKAEHYGLDRMPRIPNPSTASRDTSRNTVFGCNESRAMTLIYMPNVAYVYPSTVSTSAKGLPEEEVLGFVRNGNAIAQNNGSETWATCVGCFLMQKSSNRLPASCDACFDEYCV